MPNGEFIKVHHGYFNKQHTPGLYEKMLALIGRDRQLTWSAWGALAKYRFASAWGIFLAGVFLDRWLQFTARDILIMIPAVLATHFWWADRK